MRQDTPQSIPTLIGRAECERTHDALDRSLDHRLETVSDTQRELKAAVESLSGAVATLAGQVTEVSKSVAVLLTRQSKIVAGPATALTKAQWSGIGLAAAYGIEALGKATGWW